MRVSDSMQIDTVTRGIAGAQARQLAAAQQASSGQRIGAPSDDPIGAARLARIQASIDQTASYRQSISTVQGDLELSESTLANAGDIMQRAQEIALQGANGTLSSSDRADLAKEVGGLREQMIALANTKGSLGYLFAGSANQTVPFNSSATFVANSDAHTVEVSPGVSVDVRIDGAKTFTAAGGHDVFADLASLQSALNADDSNAVSASVNSLDTSRRQILAARTDAGDKLTRLSAADHAHDLAGTALQTQRSAVADANPTEAYSRLINTQQSLEAAVSVARTALAAIGGSMR